MQFLDNSSSPPAANSPIRRLVLVNINKLLNINIDKSVNSDGYRWRGYRKVNSSLPFFHASDPRSLFSVISCYFTRLLGLVSSIYSIRMKWSASNYEYRVNRFVWSLRFVKFFAGIYGIFHRRNMLQRKLAMKRCTLVERNVCQRIFSVCSFVHYSPCLLDLFLQQRNICWNSVRIMSSSVPRSCTTINDCPERTT